MLRLTLAVLLIVGAAAPALANQELHPGGRAFFPLWDVRTSAANPDGRITFIVLTRLAYINQAQGHRNTNEFSNCTTRFENSNGLIPVHMEYYGKTCEGRNEIIYMSCADVDVILLTNPANRVIRARPPFLSVGSEGIGALDVHLLDANAPLAVRSRANENSLMGNAIISDTVEGWAAVYPAAMAKATSCPSCGQIDSGTDVGYEPYPMEVFLPFALADGSRAGGGVLSNLLSLWAPTLLPGKVLEGTGFGVEGHWYDGRERPHLTSAQGHAIIQYLGTITGDDLSAIDPGFNVSNFICGHTDNPFVAENDGQPRDFLSTSPAGEESLNCDPLREDLPPREAGNSFFADPDHISDNFDIPGGTTSRPVGWWDLIMTDDTVDPPGIADATLGGRSGRGLAGVVLSTGSGGEPGKGVGDAIRLWHKDPCEVGPEGFGVAFGPPHLRDVGILTNLPLFGPQQEYMVFFNVFTFEIQGQLCSGLLDIGGESPE
jgi:hypothetical protein